MFYVLYFYCFPLTVLLILIIGEKFPHFYQPNNTYFSLNFSSFSLLSNFFLFISFLPIFLASHTMHKSGHLFEKEPYLYNLWIRFETSLYGQCSWHCFLFPCMLTFTTSFTCVKKLKKEWSKLELDCSFDFKTLKKKVQLWQEFYFLWVNYFALAVSNKVKKVWCLAVQYISKYKLIKLFLMISFV